jgi:tRNA (guanine9-N1)-methyltransferase
MREGTLTAAEVEVVEKARELKRARRAATKGTEENVWPGAIVIDLGFDNLMLDGEITSMVSQLTYVYAANRTAKCPVSTVLHTSFSPEHSPRLWDKMGRAQWHRWNRMFFWNGGVDALSATMKEEKEKGEEWTLPPKKKVTGDLPSPDDLSDPRLPFPPSRQLVYLSADAEEELTTLSEDEVYIIGGIVDRNRHKNLCQGKAEGLGIRTARLPIGSFIENLPTRKVLTVNQVRSADSYLAES